MPSTSSSGYDAAAVAADARQADPGLPEEEAGRLAVEVEAHLRSAGCDDVGAVARLLLDSATEVTHANVVARAAVDFCQQHDIDLG